MLCAKLKEVDVGYLVRTVFVMLATLAALIPHTVVAQVQIDITRGRVAPMPIAVVEFPGNDEESQRVGRDISSVISNDLERSGLFRPLDRDLFIQVLPSLDVQPRFAD